MMFAQYCRIESAAGGVTSTARQFIRAALGFITDSGKVREKRDARHAWLRDGLKQRDKALGVYNEIYPQRG